ncbi:TerC family protein [Asticcacaulis endophyticus]|uniref:Membrane protein n=1 Tax=Asticcacaulis endophyticus TaxID=1395890 RepID=A0A918UNM9_9CAUL|nr:TerC family protein [Asticcacaulis endophyticus]GGZ22929.1 membrane protein [Asticcacaulis endophyticus]
MDQILALFADPAVWAALVTLIVMEVVLGIDNLIFISILTNKLPEAQRARARAIGIGGALVMRILLLFTLSWIVALKEPVITLMDKGFSWRDIILIVGGLFLVYKATKEINHATEAHAAGDASETKDAPKPVTGNIASAIAQILLLDLVFSIDSILTAVGMTDHLPIMVIAVMFAVFVMFVASGPIANFISKHPSIVMLALGFLLMIGMVLIAEGFGAHIEKGYIYAAMGFSAFVEFLQMFRRKKSGTAH